MEKTYSVSLYIRDFVFLIEFLLFPTYLIINKADDFNIKVDFRNPLFYAVAFFALSIIIISCIIEIIEKEQLVDVSRIEKRFTKRYGIAFIKISTIILIILSSSVFIANFIISDKIFDAYTRKKFLFLQIFPIVILIYIHIRIFIDNYYESKINS